MVIENLYYDIWKNNEDVGGKIEAPDWLSVIVCIKELDGEIKTQVTLNGADDSIVFCVGGGNNSLYNVYIALNDGESIYTLVDYSKSKINKVSLVTGGQMGDFEEYLCVPLSLVLKAAKTFWETGQVDNELNWEYQGNV